MIRYIAICGYPLSGKTKTQEYLAKHFGVVAVDDGRILRDFGKDAFGMSEADVSTQEGKKRSTTICGKSWENRKVLGDFGKILEAHFGEDVIPEIALRKLDRSIHTTDFRMPVYSFGSVRKTQGRVYRATGTALVVEIDGSGRGIVPTGNDFDEFDRSLVDLVIPNGGSLFDLERTVVDVFTGLLTPASIVADSPKSADGHFDVV